MFHQLVDQHLAVLIVDVIVASTVYQEQVPFQFGCVCDRRTFSVTFRIVLGCVHVPFLINRVVGALVGNESDGDTRMEDVRITEHRVQCLASAAAPSGNADTVRVDKRVTACHILDASCLVFGCECADLAIDAFTPFAAARSVGSSVVDADNDISEVGDILVPEITTAPYILYGRTGRFAIDLYDDGVFLCRIEVDRFDHPSIQFEIAGGHFDELFRVQPQRSILFACLCIVLYHPYRLMLGEGNHVDH